MYIYNPFGLKIVLSDETNSHYVVHFMQHINTNVCVCVSACITIISIIDNIYTIHLKTFCTHTNIHGDSLTHRHTRRLSNTHTYINKSDWQVPEDVVLKENYVIDLPFIKLNSICPHWSFCNSIWQRQTLSVFMANLQWDTSRKAFWDMT